MFCNINYVTLKLERVVMQNGEWGILVIANKQFNIIYYLIRKFEFIDNCSLVQWYLSKCYKSSSVVLFFPCMWWVGCWSCVCLCG